MSHSFLKPSYKSKKDSEPPHEIILHPRHMDDLTLWRAFRSGDEKALLTIFDRFTRPMYSYGCKVIGDGELVKDGIQDLLIEIWQNRERLGDTDSIKFYLFKSLRRKLLRLKSKSRKPLSPGFLGEYEQETSPSPEFLLIAEQLSREKKEKAVNLLNSLTKRQQEAMFLRYFDELNCDQIAAVMELSKQAVYNIINRSLDQLKRSLGVRP